MKGFLCVLQDKDADRLTARIGRHENTLMEGADGFVNFKPVTIRQCKYLINFQGELYNRKELCQDLTLEGWDCRQVDDEELIVYAYAQWGKSCLYHFNGAFTLLIYDRGELFAAKDHMGLKPLFYARCKNSGLILADSIATILADGMIEPIVDASGIREIFALGPSLSEDKTLYRDIHALPMGSYLIAKHNNIRVKNYYRPTTKPHLDSFWETVEKVRYLVEDAIVRQGENSNACFLSGGLDSSIITAVCAKSHPNLKTYSLDYEGNSENFVGNMYQVSLDKPFIQEMVDRYESHHTLLTITQKELINMLEPALIARNLPGMADVDASLLWMCRQVKDDHENIILGGECSDEVFGGYPWFYKPELKDLDSFPWLRSMDERIDLLHESIRGFGYHDYMQKQYNDTVRDITFLEEDSEADKRARIHTMICLRWFMQTLVTRQITMGNAANLNVRSPFADVRIIDYVYNIPWDMRYYKEEEKGILRTAFEDILPASIAHRKKNPYPKTHNPLYTELIKERMREVYRDPDSVIHMLFDDKRMKELIESGGAAFKLPWYGQLMSGPQLLAYLYQLDLWVKQYHVKFML